MKFIKNILIWVIFTFGLLFFAAGIYLYNMDFSVGEEEALDLLKHEKYEARFEFLRAYDKTMHYVSIGDENLPTVVFVHGSPGSWDAFIRFMSDEKLLIRYRIISVDRPGFGKSDFGIPERSLAKQAQSIAAIIQKEQNNKPVVLVGHSFGGPVVAKIAIDFPNLVDGLIMAAASIDPDLEKTYWYQLPVHYKILSWILPRAIYSTNEEILALKKELAKMEKEWETIKQPVWVIQGDKDKLVPKENADFAESKLVNAKLKMMRESTVNHFIPWQYPELIHKALDEFLDERIE